MEQVQPETRRPRWWEYGEPVPWMLITNNAILAVLSLHPEESGRGRGTFWGALVIVPLLALLSRWHRTPHTSWVGVLALTAYSLTVLGVALVSVDAALWLSAVGVLVTIALALARVDWSDDVPD